MTDDNLHLLELVIDGPVHDAPEGAMAAPGCRCETPWLERDQDEQLHCCRCGKDYRP